MRRDHHAGTEETMPRSSPVRVLLFIPALSILFIAGCFTESGEQRPGFVADVMGAEFAAVGACCLEDGTCLIVTEEECFAQAGEYQGDETLCDPNPCEQPPPPIGACCLEDGTCLIVTEEECFAQAGEYQGDETLCDPNPCEQPPPPIGACCLEDGTCLIVTEEECFAQAGEYQGDETLCDPNPCEQPPPPIGACCLEDGTCLIVTEEECFAQAGEYQGDETLCDPNPCEQPQPEGCGLGFWKNHPDAWEPTGYQEADLVGDLFLLPVELDFLADDTLAEALRYPGGNGIEGAARLLLRTAVVAVLNAALASLDRKTMQDARHEIGPRNGQGCPLG
jgi:hypothetical protein